MWATTASHEVLPVPFNQPLIATPRIRYGPRTLPMNIYSYGGTSPLQRGNVYGSQVPLDLEPISATVLFRQRARCACPIIGYDMNSVSYEAEGISNYNALQVQVRKRLSNGLQFTASYTYSHALDEQSGLGLFVTGNNPITPQSQLCLGGFRPDARAAGQLQLHASQPSPMNSHALGYAVNGWTIGGQTVAQSGQPYSVYDYSGSVGSLYFGTDDEIGNPIVPLASGVSF